MAMRILVPMNDSEMSRHALEFALDSFDRAEITVLTVVGKPTVMMGEAVGLLLEADVEAAASEIASDVHSTAESIATERDREITTVISVGHPVRAILNRADNYDAIVMGTHGGSVQDRLFVGNVAKRVFNRSPVPVTFVR